MWHTGKSRKPIMVHVRAAPTASIRTSAARTRAPGPGWISADLAQHLQALYRKTTAVAIDSYNMGNISEFVAYNNRKIL